MSKRLRCQGMLIACVYHHSSIPELYNTKGKQQRNWYWRGANTTPTSDDPLHMAKERIDPIVGRIIQPYFTGTWVVQGESFNV